MRVTPVYLQIQCIVHIDKHIRIYHEFEGGIENSVLRIVNWHHEACLVMAYGDHKGRIFLSHPHTNNGLFFLLTTQNPILYWKNMEKAF